MLDKVKALITKPLVLISLELGETLLLYVVATTQVVNTTLVVEQEEPGHVYKVRRWSTTSARCSPTVRLATIM
jgi:hypothetical protein